MILTLELINLRGSKLTVEFRKMTTGRFEPIRRHWKMLKSESLKTRSISMIHHPFTPALHQLLFDFF